MENGKTYILYNKYTSTDCFDLNLQKGQMKILSNKYY